LLKSIFQFAKVESKKRQTRVISTCGQGLINLFTSDPILIAICLLFKPSFLSFLSRSTRLIQELTGVFLADIASLFSMFALDLDFCCQFHQRYLCTIFEHNFGAKNFKPKIQPSYKILAPKTHFRTKNARLKCWWNWLLQSNF